MKKIKNTLQTLEPTGDGIFFIIMFFAFTIFSFVLIYDLFFRAEIFNPAARGIILLSVIFNMIVIIYFYSKIIGALKNYNICPSLEEINKNKNLIKRLTIDNANIVLLQCIEEEEYELAQLIEQHIKKLNGTVSINKNL